MAWLGCSSERSNRKEAFINDLFMGAHVIMPHFVRRPIGLFPVLAFARTPKLQRSKVKLDLTRSSLP